MHKCVHTSSIHTCIRKVAYTHAYVEVGCTNAYIQVAYTHAYLEVGCTHAYIQVHICTRMLSIHIECHVHMCTHKSKHIVHAIVTQPHTYLSRCRLTVDPKYRTLSWHQKIHWPWLHRVKWIVDLNTPL